MLHSAATGALATAEWLGSVAFAIWKWFLYYADITTKHRFRNNKFRLELRERDHLPPHVHLTGGGVDVRIDIATFACTGSCPQDIRDEAVAWVEAHAAGLLKEWKKWHP